MKIKKIIIHRLPGIPRGFELNTTGTVCIVVGPNGSGKSSLTRAVKNLLWPMTEPETPFSVEAFFTWDKAHWKARREEGMQTLWMRDGQEVNSPPLPSGPVARCYEMGLLDLVIPAEGEVEKKLAGIINKEMSGGVNLSRTAENIFAISPRQATVHKRKLFETEKDYAALLRQQKILFEQEKRTAEMQRELDRCNNAETEAGLLKALKDHNEAVIELEAVRFQRDTFEKGQDKIRPDDVGTLESLNRQKREKRILIQRVTSEQEIVERQLNDLEIPPQLNDCELLDRKISEATALDNRIKQLKEDLSRCNAVIGQTLREFDKENDRKFPQAVPGRDVYPDISKAYARVAEFQALTASLDALLVLPEMQIEDPPESTVEDLLYQWSTVPDRISSSIFLTGLVPAILAAAAGWILWSTDGKTTGILIFIAGILMGGFSLWNWWRIKKGNRQRPDLEKKIISLATTRARQGLRDFFEGQRQLQQDRKEGVETSINKLRREHGLNLDAEAPDLLNLLNIIPRFRKARDEAAASEAELCEIQKQFDTLWETCLADLTEIGFPKPATVLEGKHLIEKLKARLKDRQDFQKEIDRHLNDEARYREELEEVEYQLGLFWKRLELPPQNDDNPVRLLVDNLPQWQETLDREIGLQKTVDILARSFQARPDLLDPEDAGKMGSEDLALRLKELELAIQARPALQTELSTIEVQVTEARRSLQVAEAREQRDRARNELEECRNQERENALGRLLLEDVQQTYQNTSRPGILAQASDNFKEFTLGRYELRVIPGDDNSGQFAAFDFETEENLSLTRLSDGTRAQLLLAVRLAFISEHEGAAKPPIFMDESLTSTDPERFAAVAGRLAAWAEKRKRQLFYLTSNPSDATAWESILQDANLPRPEILSLTEARSLTTGSPPIFEHSPAKTPPEPGEMTPAQYARILSVPGFSPWNPPSGTHLWYLLEDDLSLLHRLLMAAAPNLGRLISRKKELQVLGVLNLQEMVHLEGRGQCLVSFCNNWRVGRDRPITAETLLTSEAVSQAFLDKCRALLHDVQGDPRKFIASLKNKKVKRFATGNIELLETYLQEEGYLATSAVYSPEGLLETVLSAVQEEIQSGVLSVPEVRILVISWSKLAAGSQ